MDVGRDIYRRDPNTRHAQYDGAEHGYLRNIGCSFAAAFGQSRSLDIAVDLIRCARRHIGPPLSAHRGAHFLEQL